MKHRRWPLERSLFLTLLLTLLLSTTSPPQLLASQPDPDAAIQEAWSRAQRIGVYQVTTDIRQITSPLPLVTNAGRGLEEAITHIQGETDRPNDRLHMTLWQSGAGATVANGMTPDVTHGDTGIEIKVEAGTSQGRVLGEETWTEIDVSPYGGAGVLFGPAGDALSYLAGATDLQRLDTQQHTLPSGDRLTVTRYAFKLDGPALARHVRDQLETAMRADGSLPQGTNLALPQLYRDAVGEGEVWLGPEGLPARLILNVTFPEDQADQVSAHIKSDFYDYGGAITLGSLIQPGGLRAWTATHLTARQVRPHIVGLSALLLCATMGALLLTHRRSRVLYAAFVIGVVASMVATPLLRSQRVAAFYKEATAAGPETAQPREEPAAIDAGTTQEVSTATTKLASAPTSGDPGTMAECESVGPDSDTDSDGLTCAQEIALGTRPTQADSDGDTLPDGVEVWGFEFAGTTRNTDPLNHDTNNDGRMDGLECVDLAYTGNWDEYTYSPNTTPCQDTDGDGDPDLFDRDDDGDGVPDGIDASPTTHSEVTANHSLIVDGLEVGKPAFVDLQILPSKQEHLWWALNVLDWPSGDEDGQIQRKTGNDATYADVHPGAADPHFGYGDMRLVPMLEISIPWDATVLGNLPVRDDAPATITAQTDPEDWIDNDVLQSYGVSLKRADDQGNLLAYVPLNFVNDELGGARVAFSARMPYRPSTDQWGRAHQMRVVWLVHALTDSCTERQSDGSCTTWSLNNETIAQTYYEDFALAGMTVSEEQGVDLAIIYNDPAAGDATGAARSFGNDALWALANDLESTFLGARDSDGDEMRDITVAEIVRRFNHTTNGAVSEEARWGIENTLSVVQRQYGSRDAMLAALMTHDVREVLADAFHADDTPTLLFASEDTFRRARFDHHATVTGNQITIHMAQAQRETMASMQWRPYENVDGAWRNQPLDAYLDNLSQYVRADDPFFDPNTPGQDAETAELKHALLHSTYLSLVQGYSAVVQQGDGVMTHSSPVLVDDQHLMADEEKIGRQFTGYSKYVVQGAYLLNAWYENKQTERMMAQMGFEISEEMGGIRRKLNNLLLEVKGQWANLAVSIQARWESMSTTMRVGTVAGAGVLMAGVGVGLYFLLSSDRDTTNQIQIITASLATAMAAISAVQMVQRIVAAGEQAASLTERLSTATAEVSSAAKTAAVVGAIVAVLVTVGFFIYSMISEGVTAGSLEFDAALATTLATSVAQVIMIAIAFIPVAGLIIAIVCALIDGVIALVCGLTGNTAQDSWICGGITGLLAKGITWAIYGQHMMIDLEDEDRLKVGNFGTTFAAESNGFADGSKVSYHATVTNTVHKADFPASALSLPYAWQWTDSRARSSAFAYSLTKDDNSVHISRGDTNWHGDDPWTMTQTVASSALDLPAPGINGTIAGLTLNEGYEIPVQECWGLFILSVCYIRDKSDTTHLDMGKNLRYDVFPATLDEFYTLVDKDNGYALGWAQPTGEGLSFPRLEDADGDGLRCKAAGGADPNDRQWDSDGDGLSDLFEHQHGTDTDMADTDLDGLDDRTELLAGTNPRQVDSDGDGLTDGEELAGWLFTYGFDGTTPLSTRVWSDPLSVDVDADGYSDAREVIFGFHPRVPSTGDILTLDSDIQEMSASGVFTDTDGYARPGDTLHYEADVANHLNQRYAQGLLTTEFPPAARNSLVPRSFVLHPDEGTTLSGDIEVAPGAESGLMTLSQVAQAEITNPQDMLGAPRVWLQLDEDAGATEFADSAGISPQFSAACAGDSCPEAGVAGTAGNAVAFDGDNDYLSLGTGFSFGTTTAAYALWIKPDTVDGTQALVMRGDASNNHGASFGLNNGKVWIGGNVGSGWVSHTAGDVKAGEWTHVAAVFREYATAYQDHHRCEIYVNGEHIETFSDCTFQLDGLDFSTTIGRNQQGAQQFYDGLMDDVRIYTHAPSGWHVPALAVNMDTSPPRDSSDYRNSVTWEDYGHSAGPSLVAGVSGHAASFDKHQYLSCGLPGLTYEQYTMSTWIKPTDTGSASFDGEPQGVIGVSASHPNASPYLLVVGHKLRVGFGTGSEVLQFTTDDVLARNAWDHVVVTFGEQDGVFHVYVNGIERSSFDAGDKRPSAITYASHSTYIGSASTPGDFTGSPQLRLFHGSIDEVAIYREAFTAEEVGQIYRSGVEVATIAFDDPPGGTRRNEAPGTAYLQNEADATGLRNARCTGASCPVLGVPGRSWRAATFDGVDDYAELDNSTSEIFAFSGSPAKPFSLAAWIKPSSTAPELGGVILAKYNHAVEGSWFLRLLSDGRVYLHREVAPWDVVTTDSIPFDQWSHIATTYDGATMRIYVNGVEWASRADTGTTPGSSQTPVTIGAYLENGDPVKHFGGVIDDVRITQNALSIGEIATLMQAAPSLQISFEEPTGATTFANAASGLDGTCTGDACPTAGVKSQVSLGISLDGADDYVQIPDDDALNFGAQDDFTIALWVKAAASQPDTGSEDNSIVEKWSGSYGYPYTIRYFNTTSEYAGRIRVARNDAWHNPGIVSTHPINDGQFHHIAFVKSGETLNLYVNGELDGSTADTTDGTTSNNWPLTVGQRGNGINHFTGAVDELLIYRRSMVAQEVRDLFQAQVALVEDRRHTYITIDGDAPFSELQSDHAYRANEANQLFVTAGDAHSSVAKVEFAVNGAWTEAPPCQDAASGAGYCPIFVPTGEGRYRLQTRATDQAGNVEDPPPSVTIWVDASAPQATISGEPIPQRVATQEETQLVSPQPDSTNPTTWILPLSGTVDDPTLTGGESGSGIALVQVDVVAATVTPQETGMQEAVVTGNLWQSTLSFADAAPNGTLSVRTRAVDAVGNAGPWTTANLRIDGTPPNADLTFPRYHNTTTLSATQAITEVGLTLAGHVSDTLGTIRSGVQRVEVALTPNFPGSALNNERPPDGQILHWPFNDHADAHDTLTFNDISGTGNDGACARAGAAGAACPTEGEAGHTGYAVHLDGQNDAITRTALEGFPTASDSYAFALWVRSDSAEQAGIVQIGDQHLRLEEHETCTDLWLFSWCRPDGYRWTYGTGDSRITVHANEPEAWHHIAVTSDGVSTRLYVDGQMAGEASAGTPLPGSPPFTVGAGTGLAPFGGTIDEVQVFARPLSETDVRSLYLGSAPLIQLTFEAADQWPAGAGIADSATWHRTVVRHTTDGEALSARAGRMGDYALLLDGVGDYLTANSVSRDAAVATGLSFGGWVRPAASMPEDGVVVAFNASAGHNRNMVSYDTTTRRFFYFDDTTGCVSSASIYAPEQWHHVVVTLDEVGNGTLYVNGQSAATFTTPVWPDTDGTFSVGQEWDGDDAGNFFHGALDAIFVSPRVLTPVEIAAKAVGGWHETTLSSTGNDIADWSYPMPAGLEGHYQIDLRTADGLDNTSIRNQELWRGPIDTLAPRVTIERETVSGGFRYTTTAQDFNLVTNDFDSPCGPGVISAQAYYVSPWYLALMQLDEASHQRLNQISATCVLTTATTEAATACDTFGHCATATISAAPARTTNGAPTNAPLATIPAPSIAIAFTEPPTTLLSHAAVPLTGTVTAPEPLATLTVTVGNTMVHTTTWTLSEDARHIQWNATWTPPADGTYTLSAIAADWAGHTVSVTAPTSILVDTTPPELHSADVITGSAYTSLGHLRLRGTVSDTGGISRVIVDGVNGAVAAPIEAVVRDGIWQAPWDAGFDRDLDGVTLDVTVRAIDTVGRVATITEPVLVDVAPPPVATLTLRDRTSARVLESGDHLDAVSGALRLSWTEPTDGSGLGESRVIWTVESGGTTTETVTTHASGGTRSSELVVSEAARVSAALGRSDSHGNTRWQTAGPVIIDSAATPDDTAMSGMAGHDDRWMASGCTLLGVDARAQRQAHADSAADDAQHFYATWDAEALRLAWTGADWDSDGDLFITFDTLGTVDPSDSGSVRAFDPFTSTSANTAILLPYDRVAGTQMAADFVLWVQDRTRATLLAWHPGTEDWQELVTSDTPGSPLDYVFEPAPSGGETHLRIPLAALGITDPSHAPLSMVALASEEGALRIWSTMPPRSNLNSDRAVEGTTPGGIHLFALAQAYHWPALASGLCPNGMQSNGAVQLHRADLSLTLDADPTGVAYHLLGNNLFHMMDDLDQFAGHDWETLREELCSADPDDPLCERSGEQTETDLQGARTTAGTITPPPGYAPQRSTLESVPDISPHAAADDLHTLTDMAHDPVSGGDLITYTLHHTNMGDTPIYGLKLEAITRGPLSLVGGQTIVTADGEASWLVLDLGHLAPGATATTTFRGQIDLGFDTGHNYGWATLDAVIYDETGNAQVNQHEWIYLDHEVDQAGPTVGIRAVPPLIKGGENIATGTTFDQSAVPTITLQIRQPNGWVFTQTCPDTTPTDGAWSCAWNALGTTDGAIFELRAQGTDAHGQIGAWSQWLPFTLDQRPPTLSLDAATTLALEDGLIDASETTLRGNLTDNTLVGTVEICHTSDGRELCTPVALDVDTTTISQTTFVYDDVPAAPVPLGAATACELGSTLVRTFAVEDDFTVGDVAVGLNLDHTYRADVRAWLVAPSGTWQALLTTGTRAYGYDVTLRNAAATTAAEDRHDHATLQPFYTAIRRPAEALSIFDGETAQGYWHLILCDAYAEEDDGAYNRGRLTLTADRVPERTAGTWTITVPELALSDGVTQSLTVVGTDYVGHRTTGDDALKLTFRADTVAPEIQVTEAAATIPLMGTHTNLSGIVTDGSGIANLWLHVQTPTGLFVSEHLSSTAEGHWQAQLSPTTAGTYVVNVYATDQAGNTANSRSYTVTTTIKRIYMPWIAKAATESTTGLSR